MAVSLEMKGFQNVIRSIWTKEVMMERLGYKRVEGLSFWVRDLNFWEPRRLHNRPFTKQQHRAYVREQRKLRWVRRGREIRRRVALAWDALRGKEEEFYG